jgi:hypothetical protein
MSLSGQMNAAVGILQNDNGKAGEVLSQMAAAGTPGLHSGSGQAEQAGETTGDKTAAVLSNIISALKNELAQNTENTAPAGQQVQAEAGILAGTAAANTAPATAQAAQNGLPMTGDESGNAGNIEANTPSGQTIGPDALHDAGPAIPAAAPAKAENPETGGESADNGPGRSSKGKDRTESADISGAQTATLAGSKFTGVLSAEDKAVSATAAEKALNRLGEDLRSLRGGTHELRIVMHVLRVAVVGDPTGEDRRGEAAKGCAVYGRPGHAVRSSRSRPGTAAIRQGGRRLDR